MSAARPQAMVAIALVGPDRLILHVSGRLVRSALDGAADRLHRLLGMDFRSIVVDAREVLDVDDAGRSLLAEVAAGARARGNDVVVLDPVGGDRGGTRAAAS